MKKKISITMCLMTAVSVIITAVMISLVIYRKNYNEMKSMIRAEAEYISQAIDTEDINYLESVKNVTPSRIIWLTVTEMSYTTVRVKIFQITQTDLK